MWDKPRVRRAIETERKRLGQRIRALRGEADMSQEDLAERAGIHPNYLSRVETGAVNASIATIVAIAVGLKCKVSTLFG